MDLSPVNSPHDHCLHKTCPRRAAACLTCIFALCNLNKECADSFYLLFHHHFRSRWGFLLGLATFLQGWDGVKEGLDRADLFPIRFEQRCKQNSSCICLQDGSIWSTCAGVCISFTVIFIFSFVLILDRDGGHFKKLPVSSELFSLFYFGD